MVKTQGLRTKQVVKQETKCLPSHRKSHHFNALILQSISRGKRCCVSNEGVLLALMIQGDWFADVNIKENFAG
jgi:hypothetical protein